MRTSPAPLPGACYSTNALSAVSRGEPRDPESYDLSETVEGPVDAPQVETIDRCCLVFCEPCDESGYSWNAAVPAVVRIDGVACCHVHADERGVES